MTILVTGAAGFIGYHLCRALLDRGDSIIAVHRSENGLEKFAADRTNSRLRLVQADVRDQGAIDRTFAEEDIHTVFHLVGYLPHKDDLDEPSISFDTNARGTMNLLRAARRSRVSRFVYASSIDVYSEPPIHLPVDEAHPTIPSSMYGVGKMAGELLCNAYASSLAMVILRYSVVYGLGAVPKRAIPAFVRQSLAGEPITLFGGGTQSNDFVYIGDVTAAHIAALQGPPGTYNIGSGETITVRELAERILRLCGSASKPVLTGEETNKPFRFELDISKARRDLQYRPQTLDEGLQRYVADVRGTKVRK